MGKHTKRHRIPTSFFDGIAIREPRPGFFQVDFMRDGIRTRKGFSTQEDAKVFARAKALEIKNKGTASLSITDKQRVEVGEVLDKLNGRATITEAVAYWLQRHPDGTVERWDATATRYVQNMRAGNRRPASVTDKEVKLSVLSEALGNPTTVSVDGATIEEAVKRLSSANRWTASTEASYTGAGLTLLRFYKGDGRKTRITEDTMPDTWGADFIATMMHAAEAKTPGVVAALAVMTFAGIRPAEALRLGWGAVDFDQNIITLDGATTKTRTTRNVEITPNLRNWLLKYRGAGKLVSNFTLFKRQRDILKKELKITKWPNDVLRHTAATMIYARTNSVDRTCAELGHFGTDMFLRHYKGLVPKPDDVANFWAIVPRTEKEAEQGG